MNTADNQVQIADPYPPGKKRIRIAVALFYFCMGLCFATWASRIPDIKTALNLGDAALGTILFALPVGSFLMMPLSGKLVTHFGSRKVIRFAVPGYTLCMTNLGLATLVLLIVSLNYGKLVKGKSGPSMASSKKGFFSKPESALLQLGVIGFCSMASEGAMFDWSGVYFKDVVHAPSSLVILGYTSFMIMMTLGRFIADGLVIRFGRKRLLQVSGFLISTGLFTSVFFPFLIASTIGFRWLVSVFQASFHPFTVQPADKAK